MSQEAQLREACSAYAAGRHEAAIAACRRLIQRAPAYAGAHYRLALMLAGLGRFSEAIYTAGRAVEIEPRHADYQRALGGALARAGQYEKALPPLREAVRLHPGHADAWTDLAMALWGLRRVDEAIEAFDRAAAADPRDFAPRLNAAMMLLEVADARPALERLEDLHRKHPSSSTIAQARAAAMNYAGTEDPAHVLAAHRAYGRTLPAGAPPSSLARNRDPGRPLRVALLSPDLYDHSVAAFLEPILRARDPARLRVVAVHTGRVEDEATRRLRALADQWIAAPNPADGALLERLRAEHLDIAIDLCGLMDGTSLGALAARAAPVQATYLGYPNTTGVPAIDWRIVDHVTDPAGAEALATERLLRLDGCFLCYQPPADAPPVTPRAASAKVAFGSFNSARKISPACLDLWSAVLRSAPGSRMILKASAFSGATARDRVTRAFADRAIEAPRLEFRPYAPEKRAHFEAYADIDIALDTTPYNGTTTTCEALYMGAPVVTLRGGVHASRVSASLLTAAGLGDLIAPTPDEFVSIASRLAAEPARLPSLRGSLRERLLASPLCDTPGHARRFEAALLEMWRVHSEA